MKEQEYYVKIRVEGGVYFRVKAASLSEAKEKAEKEFGSTDLGELDTEVWQPVSAEDSKGKLHYYI